MRGNRYDHGWMADSRYGRDFGARPGHVQGHGHTAGYGRGQGTGNGRGYDAPLHGRYDRGWTQEMAYGREPGMGVGMNGPGMFTPFGWDPMLRWTGWDPLAGFIPYQDTPRQWSYGPAQDARRYEHDYRGNVAHRYGGDYSGRPHPSEPRMPPRQSPLYGRGGDRAVQAWARSRGYDVGYTIQPRQGPRR